VLPSRKSIVAPPYCIGRGLNMVERNEQHGRYLSSGYVDMRSAWKMCSVR
jgi:hypothetical protein